MHALLLLFVSLSLSAAPRQVPMTRAGTTSNCGDYLVQQVPLRRLLLLDRLSKPRAVGLKEDLVEMMRTLLPERLEVIRIPGAVRGEDADATHITIQTWKRPRAGQSLLRMVWENRGRVTKVVDFPRYQEGFGYTQLGVEEYDENYEVIVRPQVPLYIEEPRTTAFETHLLKWRFTKEGFLQEFEVTRLPKPAGSFRYVEVSRFAPRN